jgi:phenylacetate-CoA ligase
MHDALMSVYRNLPAPARSVAASLRGLYLRHWRRGPDFEARFAECLDRDTWSEARRLAWQEERLGRLLHRAATMVPYYRRLWGERRQRGDRSSFEYLENWPVLEKDAVRADPTAFIADDRDRRALFHEQTSGTTGKPLDIWRSRSTLTELYAMADARTLAWHSIPRATRYARLGGQLVVPTENRQPPFWVWNAAMQQLYMSTYHLAPALLPHYLDALKRHRIQYLAGYTSSVVALAHQALADGRRDLPMFATFTNAEGVDDRQRSVIEAAFGGPVRETYGQAEMVTAATECPAGRLHLWPEAGILEVWREGVPAPPGETGEFICTGLLNTDMPLVRYRIGDRGRLAPPDEACRCGRSLALLGAVEGRANDNLVTADGRRVFWLNPVFYGLPVRESQIEQVAVDRLVVRVTSAPGYDSERTQAEIARRLRDRMGEVAVLFEEVESIPRAANGKLRSVICRVAPAEVA